MIISQVENNLCELERLFSTQKPVLNAGFKIYDIQIQIKLDLVWEI